MMTLTAFLSLKEKSVLPSLADAENRCISDSLTKMHHMQSGFSAMIQLVLFLWSSEKHNLNLALVVSTSLEKMIPFTAFLSFE
jgi:hypothetical protein